jgi:hypothetical protein
MPPIVKKPTVKAPVAAGGRKKKVVVSSDSSETGSDSDMDWIDSEDEEGTVDEDDEEEEADDEEEDISATSSSNLYTDATHSSASSHRRQPKKSGRRSPTKKSASSTSPAKADGPTETFELQKFRQQLAEQFPSKYSKLRAAAGTSSRSTAGNTPNRNKRDGKRTESPAALSRRGNGKKGRKEEDEEDEEEDTFSDTSGSWITAEDDEEDGGDGSETLSDESSSIEPRRRSKRSRTGRSLTDSAQLNILVNIDGSNLGFGDLDDDEDIDSLEEDVTEDLDSEAEKTFMPEARESFSLGASSSLLSGAPSPMAAAVAEQGDEDPPRQEDPSAWSSGADDALVSKKRARPAAAVPSPLKKTSAKTTQFEEEYQETYELKAMLTEQLKKRPNNRILQKSLRECKANLQALVRKARHTNTNAYFKLMNYGHKPTDEIDYFKHRLSNAEQKLVISDFGEINRDIFVEKPYRLRVLQSAMPNKFKTVAMQRLNTLQSMDTSDTEYFKLKHWIDAFMRIPFGLFRNIEIRREDGIEKTNAFMQNAKSTLDQCVFGLNDAKMQIMQMLGQWIVNPNSVGTAIAIHGPPGTGKTSIVKDGISKILGREFAFIALGGCGDGSFLEGHSYTYEGSMWGKIVQILMDSKCMNPIIYFDELDKVSDTPRGQEIVGILTHLTDTSQNVEFHDKYFSEVSFDLSKCLFIFSYNDESLVNPILKDRMYRIQTKGYETVDKITIARNYLLPKIREQVNFTPDEVVIPDDTLRYIVSTPHLTKHESGVRNLKRCLEIIYTKLNLYRLVKPDNPLFVNDLGVKVEFPMTVTRKEVDQFIKNNEPVNPSLLAMYT